MYRSHGWSVVPPAQAFADRLYTTEPASLPAGESILWALAKEHGEPGLRYPAEDGEYERAVLDSLGL